MKPARDVLIDVALEPVAGELAEIFRGPGGRIPANDTSAAVGYAPLSRTEWLVLETERFLNGEAFKREFPETGQVKPKQGPTSRSSARRPRALIRGRWGAVTGSTV